MKNINRFTEPENLIEQPGSLKLKWVAVIAVIGIALLIFLSGCNRNDKLISTVAQNEIDHWNNYSHLRSATSDTLVVRWVDSAQKAWHKSAIKVKELLIRKEIFIMPLDSSIYLINEYIELTKDTIK